MSVGILTQYKDSERKDNYLPIATEQVFHSVWLPIINKLKLVWLPLLSTGFPIVEEDAPFVLEELLKLEKAAAQKNIDPIHFSRILRARYFFEKTDWLEVKELFFG